MEKSPRGKGEWMGQETDRIVVARQRKDPWEIRAPESKGKKPDWLLAFLQTHSATWGWAPKRQSWL